MDAPSSTNSFRALNDDVRLTIAGHLTELPDLLLGYGAVNHQLEIDAKKLFSAWPNLIMIHQMSSTAFVALQGISCLISLKVLNVDPSGSEHINKLANLQLLDVSFTKATYPEGSQISSGSSLTTLNLRATELTDTEMVSLTSQCPNLTEFCSSARMTDEGLHALSINCPNLTMLDLKFSQVTDDGIMHLKKLTSLININLNGTSITETGKAQLKTALPHLQISQ